MGESNEGHEPEASRVPYSDDDVVRVAAQLDSVAEERSRYRRFTAARDAFLSEVDGHDAIEGSTDPQDDDPESEPAPAVGPAGNWQADLDTDEIDDEYEFDDEDDRLASKLPTLEAAAWAAMRYHVDITVHGGKERARLEPNFRGPDHSEPPDTRKVSAEIQGAWTDLAVAVTRPAAKATLSHLAFQVGGPETRSHAQAAVDAYLEVSRGEGRPSDAVDAARTAVRLSRAVGDNERVTASLNALEAAAAVSIRGPAQSVGAARSALGTLVREKAQGTRALIELACETWSVGQVGDAFWALKLKVATGTDDRDQIWRDRVEHVITMAERANSNILRATHLRGALGLAEQSGIAELRERAAVLVQGIRNLDLEMMRVSASSYQFEEQFEEIIASVLLDGAAAESVVTARAGEPVEEPVRPNPERFPSWNRRLLAFANFDPPTGEPDANRELVERQHVLSPLQHLFPTQLQTPEGLPLYAPETKEERFDLDLVKWETDLLQHWTPVLAEALHRLVDPDVPPIDALAGVLSAGPASNPAIGAQLASSFHRYWSGDGQAALYTTVPMIEALIRNAVIDADRGVYRLQKSQVPGQYVGLGVLLDLFVETYAVSERDERFFGALLRHPGGWNLRNLLAHGYLANASGGVAAVSLYAAMRVIVLACRGRPSDRTPERDKDADEG